MDSPNDRWVWQDEDPFEKILRPQPSREDDGPGAVLWSEFEGEPAGVESNDPALTLVDPAIGLNINGLAVESAVQRPETSVATLTAPSPEPVRLDLHKRNGFHEPVWTTDDILSALDDLGIDLPIEHLVAPEPRDEPSNGDGTAVLPSEDQPAVTLDASNPEHPPLEEVPEPAAGDEALPTEVQNLAASSPPSTDSVPAAADPVETVQPLPDPAVSEAIEDRPPAEASRPGDPAAAEPQLASADSPEPPGAADSGAIEEPKAAAAKAPVVASRGGRAAAAAPAKVSRPASGPAALLAEGLALYESNHLGEALEALQEARALDPRNLDILTALGTVAVRQNRALEALAAFEAATALEGEAEQALFGRAVSLQLVGWLAEAEEAFQRFLERVPNCDDALVNLLTVAQAQNKKDVVIGVCERLLAHRPNAEPALRALLLLELAAGTAGDSAIRLGEQIATRNPDSFESRFNLGLAYFQAGRTTEAESAFAEALRLRPQSREALLALSIAQERAGQIEQAMATYEVALQRTSSDTPWLNLALLAASRGDLVFAESKLEECVKRFPDSKAALFHLGTVRLDQGSHRKAAEAFAACLEAAPDWAAARWNLAISLWRHGDRTRARAHAVELAARPEWSQDARRLQAQLALEERRHDDALEIYRGLMASGDKSLEVCFNAGCLLQSRGRHEAALGCFEAALEQQPQFIEVLERLAQCYERLGRKEEGQSYLRRARESARELRSRTFPRP